MTHIRQMTQADESLILATIRHPLIYPRITDDMCPPADAWTPVFEGGTVAYMGAWDDDLFLGLWVCVRLNGVTVEVHTCLLPCAAGPKGLVAAKALATWIWEKTDFRRIETTIPASNKLAARFAGRAGMTQYGVRPKSFLKNGKLEDEILMGMSHPDVR